MYSSQFSYRLQEFVSCQGTSNYLDLLRVECLKKGEKLSGLHKGFTVKKKAFDSFPVSSSKDEMISRNCLANSWIVQLSHVSFSDIAPNFINLFAVVITTFRQRILFSFKYLIKDCKSTLYNGKQGVSVNPVSHRKIVCLNIRIELWHIEQYGVISQAQLYRYTVIKATLLNILNSKTSLFVFSKSVLLILSFITLFKILFD